MRLGSVGSDYTEALACSGIGHLILIDRDTTIEHQPSGHCLPFDGRPSQMSGHGEDGSGYQSRLRCDDASGFHPERQPRRDALPVPPS
ncbi:hypothetical protein [Atopobium sp. oral taxon 416]|uniref:hypothetical protein n=1 Tax=Atopobium sp. oral taxon 416 TaxID=712157 RepID=UPI00211220CA|nr:hypothetical protein [Atopobium sp. oral taxon 416]